MASRPIGRRGGWVGIAVAACATVALSSCGGRPIAVSAAPTPAATASAIPTAPSTVIVPTDTPAPPTATAATPTSTAVPPTATAVPPTATARPLTATPRPAAAPSDPAAVARGKAIFTSSVGCGLCHTIDGLTNGDQGPNLTHIATKPYDGLPNDPAFLRRWIANPQAIKPGTIMPDLGLSAQQVDDLVAFLGTQR